MALTSELVALSDPNPDFVTKTQPASNPHLATQWVAMQQRYRQARCR